MRRQIRPWSCCGRFRLVAQGVAALVGMALSLMLMASPPASTQRDEALTAMSITGCTGGATVRLMVVAGVAVVVMGEPSSNVCCMIRMDAWYALYQTPVTRASPAQPPSADMPRSVGRTPSGNP